MLSASNCKAKRSSLRRSQSLSHHNMATQRGSHPCILSDFHDDDVFSDIAQLGSPNQEEEEKDFPDCSQSNINPIGEGDNISMKSFDGSFYQDILGYDPSNRAMNDSFQGMQSYSSNYNNNNMLNDAMMMSQSQMANYSHQPTKELSPMNENEEVNILDTAVFQTQTQAGFLWSKNKRFVVEPKEQEDPDLLITSYKISESEQFQLNFSYRESLYSQLSDIYNIAMNMSELQHLLFKLNYSST